MIRTITLALMLVAGNSFAGIGDPWYLAYRVDGGTIVQYQGPYQSVYECRSARYSLPFRAEFLGCYQ